MFMPTPNGSRAQLPSVSRDTDLSLGDGELEALLQATDWSKTSLGAQEVWPQSLRTVINIMLNSRHPMYIAWGPSLNLLFNDAYRVLLGAKATKLVDALGRPFAELWSEVWPELKLQFDKVLAGISVWADDVPMILERNGFPEEAFFTYSLNPVPDDSGRIAGVLCACTETTEKVLARRQLAKNTEKLKLVTEAAELGFFDHDLVNDEMVWSERTKSHFGLPPDAKVSRADLIAGWHPDDRDRMLKLMETLFAPGSDGRYQTEYRTIGITDGKERWIAARGQVYFDDFGKAVRLVGTSIDITDRKHTEQRLREAAQHDSLTGLPNRALLFDYCNHLLASADRLGANSAVLFIDLDRFKPINDLYGHDVGDKVLQEVARRLQICTRKEDIVSRLGGDEFVVVLPRIHSSEDPETVAQHILDKIAQPFHIDSLTLSVSPSIGISMFKQHASDLASLIRCADLAMYSAKRSGRNSFRMYSPGHDERANERLRLEIHLKHTLESNGMTLFYQPIIDIDTGRPIGAEALIRMPGENGTLLTPDEFIPIAEASGLIDQLGNWVANEACRQHQHWRNAGLPPLSMAINISAAQFRQPDFAAQLAKTVKESGMDPTCLQIEVTESTVMDNIPETIATLNELRAMGIRVALDDFGTGYSSLGYLTSLPLDKLKIDQSFINRLDTNQSSQSIADTIIGLGRTLNLKVVGEGIESEEAMTYLRSHGCDQAQGYLFSRPLPASEFESWYRNRLAH
jgi:diguanylate cyclase (GGDEF)-like protein/PAS domain S-box-containing protein